MRMSVMLSGRRLARLCVLAACGASGTVVSATRLQAADAASEVRLIQETAIPETPPLWARIDEVLRGRHRGPASPPADDAVFVRRIYFDLIGRPPTLDEFAASGAGQAGAGRLDREALIDDLLARPDFAEHYATVLDVMIMERRNDKHVSTQAWRGLLAKWLAEGRPLDEICREILAADGSGEELRPAAKFYLDREVDQNLLTRDVGRIFFGRDVQCAQCHDHPIVNDYKQSEYFGILSFLNRSFLFLDAQQSNQGYLGEKAEGQLEFASVFHPEDGKSPAKPILPGAMAMDGEPQFADAAAAYLIAPSPETRALPKFSMRQQLAVLATHPRNHAFNRNLANRLWAHLMGVGIVHPVDMHHGDNPPISADLLHMLADEWAAMGYDLRAMIKQIAMTEAYQRSSQAPDLHAWEGSGFAPDEIRAEEQTLRTRLAELADELTLAGRQSKRQLESVQRAERDAQARQQEAREHAKRAAELTAETDAQAKKLADVQALLKRQQEAAAALQAAAGEAAKAAALLADDKELAASQGLLAQRAADAAAAVPGREAEVAAQQEALTAATRLSDAQQRRVAALDSRTIALTKIIAEERGVLREILRREQQLVDQREDVRQQIDLAERRLKYADLRLQARPATPPVSDDLQRQLDDAGQALVQLWTRSYAIRGLRSLSSEQLAMATFYALDREGRARRAAEKEWLEKHKESPEAQNAEALKAHADAAALNARAEFEDQFSDYFTAAPGTPQDGFFASVDQALLMLNEPTVQGWLKPDEGSLMHRLEGLSDDEQAFALLYQSVLNRTPDEEERAAMRAYVAGRGPDRNAAFQELAWGLITSAEFRFMP